MTTLGDLKDFDVDAAVLSLWVFKKSVGADKQPVFTGRWVHTSDDLDAALKEAIKVERDRITEVHEYSLLAQTNESSALSITALETHAGLVVDQSVDEIPDRKVKNLKQIQNTDFYTIKLVNNGSVLRAVRKTDPTWRAKNAAGRLAIFYSDNMLALDADPGFNISKSIDFFVLSDNVLIAQKSNFESVLNFKTAHLEDFQALLVEDDFKGVFSSMETLLDYVGTNKIQLRRASAIRQKGHYKNPRFMENLRVNHAKFGLSLQFDAAGQIVPSLETCKDIIQALLDHRLVSGFSDNVYDVQDAASVAV